MLMSICLMVIREVVGAKDGPFLNMKIFHVDNG